MGDRPGSNRTRGVTGLSSTGCVGTSRIGTFGYYEQHRIQSYRPYHCTRVKCLGRECLKCENGTIRQDKGREAMSRRAAQLAQRIEQGAAALAEYAEALSDAQWRTVVPSDGRQVGVIIHHVASVYPIEVHLATEIASGKPITGLTWNAVA